MSWELFTWKKSMREMIEKMCYMARKVYKCPICEGKLIRMPEYNTFHCPQCEDNYSEDIILEYDKAFREGRRGGGDVYIGD